MQIINWLELHPQAAEIEALNTRLTQAAPVRKVRQLLVYLTLQGYPWLGRRDLIPVYHPSETYKKGQSLALPLPGPQKVRPTVWQVARIKQAQAAENAIQGHFQALTLEVSGKEIHVAGGLAPIEAARFPRLEFSTATESLEYQSAWFADTFSRPLQTVLENLCQRGQLRGRFSGETYLPKGLAALRPGALTPIFEALHPSHPWVSIEDLLAGLPELGGLNPDLARVRIYAALQESPYLSLGGERWTTAALYETLNREVPRGLPVARIRSKLNIWTEQDERDLGAYQRQSMPAEARRALDELEAGGVPAMPVSQEWRPPSSPVKLPTLNYLHITQAYFPVDHIIHAFAPDVRMVFIQFIEGPRQPFLLDRDTGQLKALHPETLRDRILESNIPAGTYLWLEYQGGENYRIAPRPLPASRMVPCKLASLQNGQLHIEHTEIPMFYEGDPYVFKANMRFEDIAALFAEARQANVSVRDAIIYAIQELCAGDPRNRAHRTDIFNAVFLKRMCSPNSVSLLLYTQPCFEQLGDGFFRYRPAIQEAEPVSPLESEKKSASRFLPAAPQVELTVLIPEIEPATPEGAPVVKTVPFPAEIPPSLPVEPHSFPELPDPDEWPELGEPAEADEPVLPEAVSAPVNNLASLPVDPAEPEPPARQALADLFKQLESDLQQIRQQGQQAIQQGLYAEAERFARQGEAIGERIADLRSLAEDWDTLVQPVETGSASPVAEFPIEGFQPATAIEEIPPVTGTEQTAPEEAELPTPDAVTDRELPDEPEPETATDLEEFPSLPETEPTAPEETKLPEPDAVNAEELLEEPKLETGTDLEEAPLASEFEQTFPQEITLAEPARLESRIPVPAAREKEPEHTLPLESSIQLEFEPAQSALPESGPVLSTEPQQEDETPPAPLPLYRRILRGLAGWFRKLFGGHHDGCF